MKIHRDDITDLTIYEADIKLPILAKLCVLGIIIVIIIIALPIWIYLGIVWLYYSKRAENWRLRQRTKRWAKKRTNKLTSSPYGPGDD
ncbi:hypothetical protein KAR91_49125 [Candidatus Pacearchaeota archaeon]|nr:hypothetical protein [Candidatus Pacearchaeota archaeon]